MRYLIICDIWDGEKTTKGRGEITTYIPLRTLRRINQIEKAVAEKLSVKKVIIQDFKPLGSGKRMRKKGD